MDLEVNNDPHVGLKHINTDAVLTLINKEQYRLYTEELHSLSSYIRVCNVCFQMP